jgi:hypothetical protein
MRRFVATLTLTLLAVAPSARAADPPFVGWSQLLPGLATAYEPSSENDCAAGRVHCVDAAIREMTRRFDPLAERCDHDAIFALAYLLTTQEYRHTIDDPTFFQDTPFVNHEDAVFAGFYFAAYDAWHAGAWAPEAWRIAFQAAADHRVSAAGDLALGINAHVQRDLPFVLAGIGLVKPDGTTRKTDHDRVNRFLNRVTDGLTAQIAEQFDPTVDDSNLPTSVDDVVSFQIIPTWREIAWRNAERLASASTPAAWAQVAASIESYAASQARLLVAQSAYPLGLGAAARDDFCAAHHG